MKSYLLRVGALVLLVVSIGMGWLYRDQFGVENIEGWVRQLGFWGPLAFVGIFCVAPALLLPGSVLTLAGGALFGPLTGAFLSLTGATIGATVAFLIARYLAANWVEHRVAFLIARYLAANWVEHRVAGRLQEIKAGVEREGWRFVAFVRLVPIFPFNLLNYALGLTRIAVQTFTVTSFVTMAPGALAYAYLGYAGREALSGGPGLVRKGLLALALLATVALLPSLIRRWRRPAKLQPHQLQGQLSQAEAPLVLDVRNPDEFVGEHGHISEAVLSPLPELANKLSELKIPRTRTIVTV